MQKINSEVMVLLFSGQGYNDDDVQEVLNLGARDLLKKPFQIETLSDKLNSFFGIKL